MERVQKLLNDFGLSNAEAEVYIFLAANGPSKSNDLTIGLNMTTQQLSLIVKELQKKGAIVVSVKPIVLYTALDFEELLNQYIKLNLNQAQLIKKTKQELLTSWNNIPPNNSDDHKN